MQVFSFVLTYCNHLCTAHSFSTLVCIVFEDWPQISLNNFILLSHIFSKIDPIVFSKLNFKLISICWWIFWSNKIAVFLFFQSCNRFHHHACIPDPHSQQLLRESQHTGAPNPWIIFQMSSLVNCCSLPCTFCLFCRYYLLCY